MSFKILSGILESLKWQTVGVSLSFTGSHQQIRWRRPLEPRLRTPYWLQQKFKNEGDEKLTEANKIFIDKIIKKNYEISDPLFAKSSPLKEKPLDKVEWQPGYERTGVIGIKLGTLRQFYKDGKYTTLTLIQVLENHVINYIPPGTIDRRPYARRYVNKTKGKGNLIVGAVTDDPQKYTREYCELFKKSGLLPKKILTKFPVSPEARIQIGTPLYAGHFKVGDIVDVTGTTIYRGFQGVMKRWGFSGMPATHGQTKTHRRPGNIGAGGEKGRVWPGKKMPGHMGYRTRTVHGLQILRINHKHNVLYVPGLIPGDTNSFVYVHDTISVTTKTRKKLKERNIPYFPTYYPEEHPERPEEEFFDTLFNFSDPSITFTPDPPSKKK